MFKILTPIPRQVTIAFSGGVDSVAVVDFLSKNHDVTCAFFHHNTTNSEQAFEFVNKFCSERKLPLLIGVLNTAKPKKLSEEEFWRRERYEFLNAFETVVTAHQLDDCVETYIWSSLHGKPKVPKVVRGNIIRPFLTTPKSEFIKWCNNKHISWCEDLSNDNENYTRNYIRKNLIKPAFYVNPGLYKTVKKIIEKNI